MASELGGAGPGGLPNEGNYRGSFGPGAGASGPQSPPRPSALPSVFYLRRDKPGIHLKPSQNRGNGPNKFQPSDADKQVRKLAKDLKKRQWVFFFIMLFLFVLAMIGFVFGAIYIANKVDSDKIKDNTIVTADLNNEATEFLKSVPEGGVTLSSIINGSVTTVNKRRHCAVHTPIA